MDDSEQEKQKSAYLDTMFLQALLGRGEANRVMDEIVAERIAKEAVDGFGGLLIHDEFTDFPTGEEQRDA